MSVRRYPRPAMIAMLGLALAVGAGSLYAVPAPHPLDPVMRRAALRMAEMAAVIRAARQARGVAIDARYDPNRTGMIGVEWSPITTTLGDLAAKRTATNPNTAAGLVMWLDAAGVREGSLIAVGASGSFPGLVVATLAAAWAMGAEPVVVSTVASSNWGANVPEFTWLDMEAALHRAGLAPRSAAASLGGEDDAGQGPDAQARALLNRAVSRSGVPLIEGASLRERIEARMDVYDRAAGGRPIAAFVNVGGAVANIGTCLEILRVPPGVHTSLPECRGEPGAMWLMSRGGVPVIHLLHVAGIASALGLPIDPVPLPVPGRGAPFARPPRALAAGLLAFLLAGLGLIVRGSRAPSRDRSSSIR
jgi:poly-gamma-glutamate system protein